MSDISRHTPGVISGRRVLIVEDELVIALELVSQLESLGCTVVGPAGSVAQAIVLLSDCTPEAALLDVNVRGARVTPVAHACQERGIPFALVTGYGRLELEENLLQSAPRVHKPFHAADLQQTLADLLVRKCKS